MAYPAFLIAEPYSYIPVFATKTVTSDVKVSIVHNSLSHALNASQREIKHEVAEYFSDVPELVAIAGCESGFRQFNDDGTVLRGSVTPDVGLFQISEKYWLDYSSQLGYNIYTIDGNMAMAKYIYEKQKLNAWNASRKCWDM